jgi:hypothetical protein
MATTMFLPFMERVKFALKHVTSSPADIKAIADETRCANPQCMLLDPRAFGKEVRRAMCRVWKMDG